MPLERITRTRSKIHVRHEHTLFCPVYVLDRKLQGAAKGLPKWDPHFQAGVYMGMSPNHASSVTLVLNLATGHITPQYHVIFDDNFSTVVLIIQLLFTYLTFDLKSTCFE